MSPTSDPKVEIQPIAVGLIWSVEHVVVGCRPANVDLAGYDEFPGGKCLRGESPEDAVVRECAEETGLQVRVCHLRLKARHDYAHGRLLIHFFDCSLAQPEPLPSPIPPFRWVHRRDLFQLRFPPANAALLASLRETDVSHRRWRK